MTRAEDGWFAMWAVSMPRQWNCWKPRAGSAQDVLRSSAPRLADTVQVVKTYINGGMDAADRARYRGVLSAGTCADWRWRDGSGDPSSRTHHRCLWLLLGAPRRAGAVALVRRLRRGVHLGPVRAVRSPARPVPGARAAALIAAVEGRELLCSSARPAPKIRVALRLTSG